MKGHNSQVSAIAPPDEEFPDLEAVDQDAIYNVIEKFLKKAIPVKGAQLSVVAGSNNRVSTPKVPYIVVQIMHEEQISTGETRYTDTHKIVKNISKIIVQFAFFGSENIKAHKMVKAFVMRFNDSWASEQFAQYGKDLYPLYSNDFQNQPRVNMEGQYEDCYSVTAYFEYHPEVGMCQDSAKELIMETKPV